MSLPTHPRIMVEMPDCDEALGLTAQGFVRPPSDELRGNVTRNLGRADLCLTVRDAGRLVAYSTFRSFEHGPTAAEVLHLNGIIIDPGEQGRGLGAQLLESALGTMQPAYLTFRTQSARMRSLGEKVTTRLYPDSTGLSGIPERHREIGEFVANQIGGAFPVERGLYDGQPLYGARQSHPREAELAQFCDFDAGDAVLFVGDTAGRQPVLVD
jgi:hypothetical protein